MKITTHRTDLPVALIFDLDPAWNASDRCEVVEEVSVLATQLRGLGHPLKMVPIMDADVEGALRRFSPERWIIFNWCESLPGDPRGEVRVVEILERLGFTFTGASASVLRMNQSKPRMKRLMDAYEIPTPRWELFDAPAAKSWSDFPAIVKPAYEHASIGIGPESVVGSPEELEERIAHVLETYDQEAIVEDFIDGREFHVNLWGNGKLFMLPPVEMDFSAFADLHDRLCSYDAKFLPESRHYREIEIRVPAALSAAQQNRMGDLCRRAYRVAGCRDYARLDLRLAGDTFHVLDINANADLASEASFSYAAEAAGYSYGAMASRLVNLAAVRHPVFGKSIRGDFSRRRVRVEREEFRETPARVVRMRRG
jgi:D-alanine-D-alanine ligase